MSKSKFIIEKFAKLFEQGIISYKDLSEEIVNIVRSQRDEIVLRMKISTKEETEVLKKRIEKLEKEIKTLKSKNYKLWKKYYSGANGLFSIVVKSKKKSSVIKFVNSLELFGIGYSWGGFESLVLLQELRAKTKYTEARKYFRFAKDEHIVRLHIGLEDPKDLIEDLKKSLKYIK